MPLHKFICPIERREVDLDHFDHCTANNGRPAASPWLARMLAHKYREDKRHAGLDLTATRTMSCPRQVYIETQLPFALDPGKVSLRTRGDALHVMAGEWFDPEVWFTEERDPDRCVLRGTLFGRTISCKMDAIRKDMSEIVDMKFRSDFSERFRKQQEGKARAEDCVQLNVIRLLLAQQEWALQMGYDPEKVKLTVWDHAGEPEALAARHMDEEAMLAVRPGGGEYCVGEILAIWDGMLQMYAERNVMTLEQVGAMLPLVGRSMFRGQKCPKYCDVEKICTKMVMQYGEPQLEVAESGPSGIVLPE